MKLAYFRTDDLDIATVEKDGITYYQKDKEQLPIFNGGDGTDPLIAKAYLKAVAEKELYRGWETTEEKIAGTMLARIEV